VGMSVWVGVRVCERVSPYCIDISVCVHLSVSMQPCVLCLMCLCVFVCLHVCLSTPECERHDVFEWCV